MGGGEIFREKTPINTKYINIFLTALAGQSSQRQTRALPRTKWRFYWGIQHKMAGLSQGQFPVCPRKGSSLSEKVPDPPWTPSRPNCLCLLVLFLARVCDHLLRKNGVEEKTSKEVPQKSFHQTSATGLFFMGYG